MIKRLFQWMVVSIILLCMMAAILGVSFYQFLHTPLNVAEKGTVLILSPGISVQKIATLLSETNILPTHFILPSRLWFLLTVRLEGTWNKLKAGEYFVKPGTTSIDLVQQLCEGKVMQHALTIVPGWDFERLLTAVHGSPYLDYLTFVALKFQCMLFQLRK